MTTDVGKKRSDEVTSTKKDDEQRQVDGEPAPTFEKVLAEALDRFDYLRLTTTDLHGIARHQSVPRSHFSNCIKHGMTFYTGIFVIIVLFALLYGYVLFVMTCIIVYGYINKYVHANE